MTVVLLYLTLSLEQLVRILPWVVTSNKHLYSTARGGEGGGCEFCFSLYDGRCY